MKNILCLLLFSAALPASANVAHALLKGSRELMELASRFFAEGFAESQAQAMADHVRRKVWWGAFKRRVSLVFRPLNLFTYQYSIAIASNQENCPQFGLDWAEARRMS